MKVPFFLFKEIFFRFCFSLVISPPNVGCKFIPLKSRDACPTDWTSQVPLSKSHFRVVLGIQKYWKNGFPTCSSSSFTIVHLLHCTVYLSQLMLVRYHELNSTLHLDFFFNPLRFILSMSWILTLPFYIKSINILEESQQI